MPANKKYLTSSPWKRFLKISAGFVGGFIVTLCFFMVIIQFYTKPGAVVTLQYGGFILWVTLMILAFLAKNPYKIWGLYLLISLLLGLIIHLNQ